MLLIFDLDGVLLESKGLHEAAFLGALEEVSGVRVSHEEHAANLCGLPTVKKLEVLGIDPSVSEKVFARKQELTFRLMNQYVRVPEHVHGMISTLAYHHALCIASNAIEEFCKKALDIIGWDMPVFSAEFYHPKPSPDMYQSAMNYFGVDPTRTIIFEDSQFGLRGGFASGAHMFIARDPYDVTLDSVRRYIKCVTS